MTNILLAVIATVLVLGLAFCFLLLLSPPASGARAKPRNAVPRAVPRSAPPPIARVRVARARTVPVAKPEIIDAEFVEVREPAVCGTAPRLLLPPTSPVRAADSRSLVVTARANAPSRAPAPVTMRHPQPDPYRRSALSDLGRIVDVTA
jgi:hypothetical protein